MLRWALDRARKDPADLEHRFGTLDQWLAGDAQPTLKQLEGFARATHAPLGYFFLATPPEEPVPIPDFRTVAGRGVGRPSPELLDTIHDCQRRQEWYQRYARSTGMEPVAFAGSAALADDPAAIAGRMRELLRFSVAERASVPTWEMALRQFRQQAQDAGVLVMASGIVASNTQRPLDPDEFRGFALADGLAPLVFVNGKDTKSAQMFTLAHELAHLWLGQSALSDAGPRTVPTQRTEAWCNAVAAELLVPLDEIAAAFDPANDLERETQRMARRFKVSTLVVMRRLLDAGFLGQGAFEAAYDAEIGRLRRVGSSSGGDFYRTTLARVGERFARAVAVSTLEGRSTFTEAFGLLGFNNMKTFRELSAQVGVEF
jgi:Zn-dependent peptidase ImmA (M78 family)